MSFLREVESFKAEKLKSVNTTVTTAEGRKFLELKGGDGGIITVDTGEHSLGFCEDLSPDDKLYKVLDNLFLSSQDGARNLEELHQNNISHILNVGTGIENAFPKVIGHCWTWFSRSLITRLLRYWICQKLPFASTSQGCLILSKMAWQVVQCLFTAMLVFLVL
ncbi:dual specificity protein phosphatase 19-like isoform X2 [Pocillopora verrucosa]|uniref:dual specificity protein phosphatase 19-like isoform X2 n=1 Tax=Pocillopora verrucosa TaxID=203993 RepID=UPI003342CC00